jgi:hypothetical protein
MSENIIVNEDIKNIIINETTNKVIASALGPQGPRGKTILNGTGAPSNSLGLEGDFYYDKSTTMFYGPKLSDTTWSGAVSYPLQQLPGEFAKEMSWSLAQVTGPVSGSYSVTLNHNLGFKPNVTIKNSAGDVLETGIDYNSNDTLTLTMAQPFSGTAYLS